jgi:DNA-binding CsgD family transcriptional regulator
LKTFPEVLQVYRRSPVGYYFERRVKVDHNEFYKSDYYNMLMAPLKWERNLAVGVVGSGRPLATIQLPRRAKEPDFRKRDIRLLEIVTPFIAHALTDRQEDSRYVESEDRGLVIVDEKGTVQHASREARRLLLTVRFATSSPRMSFGVGSSPLPAEVVRICRNIAAWSETRPISAPPVWRCRNEWGEFVFRIFRMDGEAVLSASRLIGIFIERCEPLRLKLLRRFGELPLSNRETECCLALVEGLSRTEIAERLGVSEMTAVTHCRNLYGKLNVHSRAELAEKLRVL